MKCKKEKYLIFRFQKIILTDTINILDKKRIDKMKIVSVGEIFGEAVNRIHDGESVSALFEF